MKGFTLEIRESELKALGTARSTSWMVVRWLGLLTLHLKRVKYWFLFGLLSRPSGIKLTLAFSQFLRGIHPVPRFLGQAIPLRAADLRNMLERTDDFNGAEAMCPRLPAGEVVLGIDWTRRHAEERARLEDVLDCAPEADDACIRAIVRRRCADEIGTKTGLKGVNLARLCEDVALDVAHEYLGIGVDAQDQREHLRPIIRWLAAQVFQAPVKGSNEEIFARVATDRIQQLASICMEEQEAELVAREKAGDPIPKKEMTVLQRLISLERDSSEPSWLDEDWVLRNAVTLTVFGSVTSARAMTQAIPQLVQCKSRWSVARDAAERLKELGHETYDQRKATTAEWFAMKSARVVMLKVVLEAMRWHPMLSMLGFRTALRDTTLAPSTNERTKVRSGTQVLPLLLAAMHDKEAFPDPDRFCPHEREITDHLHFGAGPHKCVGHRMAEVQLEEITFALFSHSFLKRQPRTCSAIEYDGPAVIGLEFV